ncbi:23542_t:CDS:1, partial [Gigaspora margarita]
LNFLQMCYPPILLVLKISEKELLEVKYENNESSSGLLFKNNKSI